FEKVTEYPRSLPGAWLEAGLTDLSSVRLAAPPTVTLPPNSDVAPATGAGAGSTEPFDTPAGTAMLKRTRVVVSAATLRPFTGLVYDPVVASASAAEPSVSVATHVIPSPKPLGSAAARKISIVDPGRANPARLSLPEPISAPVITGKFRRPFPPASPSPDSF